jgi:hypothetical protein
MTENDAKTLPPLGPATSASDFASWGFQQVAYVKRVEAEGQILWAIHGADGSQIGLGPNRETSMAAVLQHDLEPLSCH